MPAKTKPVAHDTEVIEVAKRHYPKCSCGWSSIRYGGFEKDADARSQCSVHLRDVKEKEAALRSRQVRAKLIEDALAAARRR